MAARGEDDIHIFGLGHIDGRIAEAGDVNAVQRQDHVARFLAGVDNDAAVIQRAGDGVFAGGGDGHGAPVDGNAAACVFGAVAV